MIQLVAWAPPDWTQCVVAWTWILENYSGGPHDIYAWCDQYPSSARYHVHGWQSTEGFAFRFEDARDATVFKLTWPAL